jgi:hypothetical protein
MEGGHYFKGDLKISFMQSRQFHLNWLLKIYIIFLKKSRLNVKYSVTKINDKMFGN